MRPYTGAKKFIHFIYYYYLKKNVDNSTAMTSLIITSRIINYNLSV